MPTMETKPCPHHWIVEPGGQRYSKARCRLCKETKDFDNAPPLARKFGSSYPTRGPVPGGG